MPTTTESHRIAVIPGDGVGPEVIGESRRVLEAALALSGESVEWSTFDWGSDYYRSTGRMMPADAIEVLSHFDAIYFGAVGDPEVPDDLAVWGLVLPIRRHFDQFVNLRPVRWFPGVPARLAEKTCDDVDMMFVRENVEGEYADIGGFSSPEGRPASAVQTGLFTRAGIERVARFAFEQARSRDHHLTSVTKSNALRYSMVLWDEVVAETATDFPDVEVQKMHVDAVAYKMITNPEQFDVVVASNLFGDILTDLGAALQGSLGVAASANLDPSRRHPSMFEPIHGSAPDIAGKGVANPSGAVWAGSMMLEHVGAVTSADLVIDCLKRALRTSALTPDLGGTSTTKEFTDRMIELLDVDSGSGGAARGDS